MENTKGGWLQISIQSAKDAYVGGIKNGIKSQSATLGNTKGFIVQKATPPVLLNCTDSFENNNHNLTAQDMGLN